MGQANGSESSINSTNRLIIKYDRPVSAKTISSNPAIANLTDNRALNVRTMANGAQVVDFGLHQPVEKMLEIAQEISEQPGVVYAEPDYIMKPMAVPNDSRYNDQWHYFENAGGMNLPAAWDITTGSPNVTVAVIDSGVRSHADLVSNLLPGYDFISDVDVSQDGNGRDADANDPGDFTPAGACGVNSRGIPVPERDENSSWHGTHVAGTIAANSNNGQGVAGVSWRSRILPVRALGRCGGYTSDITDGMLWAAGISVAGVPDNPNPAKVLNLSLGGESPCTRTYRDTIARVRAQGATIVVAAGNENQNAANVSPASCDGVITVAANKRDGGRAYYSNYGNVIDVTAPGGETINVPSDGILSTLNSGTKGPVSDSYSFYQGTSMATPHVAGVAALMYAEKPDITPDQVEQIIKDTARAFPSVSQRQCTTLLCGEGIIDAASALRAVNDDSNGSSDNQLKKGVAINNLRGSQGQRLEYTLLVPEGATQLKFMTYGGSGDADLRVRFNTKPTDAEFDCLSENSNNSEECLIKSPKAGTWHIAVSGYRSFSGLSLKADYAGADGTSNEYANNTPVYIPDNSVEGITSTINSSYAGKADNITVAVDVTHRYRGDLELQLIAPNGDTKILKHASANDSGEDIKKSYQLSMPTIAAKGIWSLKVSDHYRSDRGTLNKWSIRFD